MEYVNNTGEAVRVREIERSENGLEHYRWVTVKDGKTIEITNAVQAKNLGLTPVVVKKEAKPKGEKESDGEESEEQDGSEDGGELSDEEQTANIVEAYKEKLQAINGIGKATAEDIISQYPLQKDLVEAIGLGKKIALRDDIEAALREAFK